MSEEPASVAGPQGLGDAAVDQTEARKAASSRLRHSGHLIEHHRLGAAGSAAAAVEQAEGE
jgi:hypothetical protein